jgi:surfeit locus 1 family protein
VIRFRPAPVMSVLALAALALLLSLGAWQLQRKAWKEGLIAEIAARAAAPPMSLRDALNTADHLPADQHGQIEFRRVRVTGPIVEAKPIPFATPDPDEVHRALVPVLAEGRTVFLDIRTPGEGVPLGDAKTFDGEGVLRFGKPANNFTPPNDVARDQWFWPDLQAAAQARGLPAPAPFFLAIQAPGGPPNNSATPDLPNRHLEYALTWFGLAGTLVGVYLAWHHKAGRLSFGKRP